MEERTEFFDASAYMLFEASGDSEAVSFDGAMDQESDAAPAEDDAQSCSYGSSLADSNFEDEVGGGAPDDIRRADYDYCSEEEEDDGGGSEEEDGVVDQCCGRRKAAAVDKPIKSQACEDSNMKTMSEREGDRLFWEACLAS